MADEGRKPILVIGYGNDLRSDDGAGRWVADQIEAMDLPNVEVLSIMQLTPEIALDIVNRDLVIFVDASVDTDELRIEDIQANPEATVMTHHGDPASLLSLASAEGGAPRGAMLVLIPAQNLEMGFEPSRATAVGSEAAVDTIARLAQADSDDEPLLHS